MQTVLNAWLNGNRDYAAGLLIYQAHGTSTALKNVLAMGPSPYNRRKLASALAQLLTTQKSTPASGPVTKEKLTAERTLLFKEAAALHSQLPGAPTDGQRLQLATEILNRFDKINEIWDILAYYDKYQRWPGAAPELAPDLTYQQATKRLANIRPRISKLKKQTNKETELEQLQAEKLQLENHLNKLLIEC